MKLFKLTGAGILAFAVCLSLSCTHRDGADYTVIGNSSTYIEKDTRVYVTKPSIVSLEDDDIHDKTNPAIKTLEEPTAAMGDFPFDRRGGINWVKAIDEGIINPRMSRDGKHEYMNIMDMDIIFKNTGQMPWVRFPHLAHTRWLDCSNCHPKIFIPQKGGNPGIGMDAILGGKYCGRCHDKVAFPLWTCERCHSVPHKGSPAAWWRKTDDPFPATKQEEYKENPDQDNN